ncbi:hypothetical protein PHMEG_00025903 [Phytophthora megakarya]|uniref:Uncharacterized protein n=1 Tax=Phytophthora megakarya TaxID=4795 RepID=A0A225VAW5_9STRA|nr:hypothetical protein PHMEG_00025903 [Phytophthora megakarya]
MDNGAVMLAAAVTKVKNGKALVPAVNAYGGRVKLPGRKELGVWIPVDADMRVLEMNGDLDQETLLSWMSELGDTATPLEDEKQVNVGADGPHCYAPTES